MNRVYLMPMIAFEIRGIPGRKPKYEDVIRSVGGTCYRSEYGAEPTCVVSAVNIDAATHATIVADGSCAALPADLTQQVGSGALATVRNTLEAFNIPGAQLVQANTTYRQVIRGVVIIFNLAQRLEEMGINSLFGAGVTLNTTFGQLPQDWKDALVGLATSFQMDTSSVTGATTVRQIFKALLDQWPATGVGLGELF